MTDVGKIFLSSRDPIFIGVKEFLETKPSKLFTATWVNHFSVKVLFDRQQDINSIDLIGVDGIFLDYMTGIGPQRSSADLVLPEVLRTLDLKVGIMGGEAHILEKKVRELENRFPKCQVVLAMDGYSHIDLFDLFEKINTAEVNLLIVAAGSPKQEEILNWFCSHGRYLNESIAILTCGGWLDQLLFSSYYPSWAYPLRLNWLVRMFRDPKRLWRRYLVAPFLFLLKKNCIEEYLLQASGYKNFRIRQLNLQNKL